MSIRPDTHIPERLVGAEHAIESLERRLTDRLDDGARRFAAIGRQIEDLERQVAPQPTDKFKAAGLVFAIAIAVGAWVWQAARYPDRSEYYQLASKVEAATDEFNAKLERMVEAQQKRSTDIALLQSTVEALREQVARPRGRR